MKTNKLMKTIGLFGLLSMNLAMAAESSGNGNGGVSVVCRDQAGKITRAELLDIFEGREVYGRSYSNAVNDFETRLQLAQLGLINYPGILDDFKKELLNVQNNLDFKSDLIELQPTNDAFPILGLKGCKYEQVANYTPFGQILVSQEIYNSFDVTNKAALLVHEAAYAMMRTNGETNSLNARRFTAYIMASNQDQKVIDQILEDHGGSVTTTCGVNGTVRQRIKNCDKKFGNFALVAKTKEGFEIYQDLASGLIWSDRLTSPMNHYNAEKACKADLKDIVGISGLTWKLPSEEDYEQAVKNGIRQALPNMNYYFWTSSVGRDSKFLAGVFFGGSAYGDGMGNRKNDTDISVRCAGR